MCTIVQVCVTGTDVATEVKSELKTLGVQTQYRESATQTVPFEPELVIGSSLKEDNTKTTRRNVDLALLKGVATETCTVEFVELLRSEEAFKKRLPPLDSEGALVQRRQMIAEKETEKWRQRETVLKRKQHGTIRAFEEELYKQEDSRDADIEAKTVRRFQDKSTENSYTGRGKRTTNGVTDPETMKWLRETPKKKTSNIDAFANVCSTLYLPVPREGKLLPKSINVEDAREPTKVATLDLIGEKLTKEWMRSPSVEECPKATRKMLKLERDLDVISDAIQTSARDGSRGHGPCWIAPEVSINATAKREGKQIQGTSYS